MQTVKEFPYLKIIWDEETRSMISQWRGGHVGRNIKEGLDATLVEYKKKLPGAQWIGDTTDIGVIGLEEQAWIDKEWFPQLLATEIQFMVVIQPKSAVAKLMVNQIVSKVPGTRLTIFNCATLEEAREWMKKQKF
jgi:hypothetical protein